MITTLFALLLPILPASLDVSVQPAPIASLIATEVDANDPVKHSQEIRVSKGRFVSVEFQANADGHCYLTFAARNLVFAAGYHAVAHVDLLDEHGNIIARIAMPKLGLKPAWTAREYKRQVNMEAQLSPEGRARLRSVRFSASEDAGGPGLPTELRGIIEWVKQV